MSAAPPHGHRDGDELRIGLLFRGSRSVDPLAARGAQRLVGLARVLRDRGVVVDHIAFDEESAAAVREQLLAQHGVLVWVNPIQDGVDRSRLDPLLRDATAAGVWVSADPAVVLQLGTKEVLYTTKEVGWGSDVELYRSTGDLRARFPDVLARDGARVLKQARGNGGNGVWKVERLALEEPVTLGSLVRVRHALTRLEAGSEDVALGAFLDRFDRYFPWSGSIVDQPFQRRLADGAIRCYLVHDKVVGYHHQWPQGLLDPTSPGALAEPRDSSFAGPDAPAYARLREATEEEWVPRMREVLGLSAEQLPAIWDADFLYGPQAANGADTYVLCEVNVSAVWPYPESATALLAEAAISRSREHRDRRER